LSKIKVNEIVNRNGSSITIGDANTSTVAINSGTTLTGFSSTGIDDNATSTAVTIDSSNNVGIGTSSPDSPLTISNSGTGTANAIELENFSGESSYIKAKRGLTLSADYLDNSNASQSNITFETDGSEAMRIDGSANLKFNSGYGSVATAYGCRAWVNFNGTGTVAIRDSGNVSSITDNDNGDYTVNFSNNLPDNNYSAVASSGSEYTGTIIYNDGAHCSVFNYSSGNVQIITGTYGQGITNNISNAEAVSVAIFR